MLEVPRSHVPGIVWPALPDAAAATTLAVAWQLERTQWWTPAQLAQAQRAQLEGLLRHAAATVPHYQGLDPARALDAWGDVPLLTRDALIDAGDALLSRGYPAPHGAPGEIATSRTTGRPVRVRGNAVIATYWNAITLRDHAWHRRDLGAHLAAIRHTDGAAPPDGERRHGWGPATALLAPDAPLSLLSVRSTTEEQLAWLRREDPAYLLVYPSVLDGLVRRMAATGERLPRLREVRTISEALSPATRGLCADVLEVPVADTYSAQEVGYVALQCPDHPMSPRYHVQAERLVVEVLRDDGTPCRPGELGRVVVTDLHNFATPLVRYELGDYAEVGGPCACGRGLPVLTRIVGRRRNLLTYPDGRTAWPVFTVALREAARYRELQLVQPRVDALVLRVVPEPGCPLDAAARAALVAALRRCLEHPFEVAIEEVDTLDRSPTGKLEEVVSRVKR